MDELTRERFWPNPLPPPVFDDMDAIVERRKVLVGDDSESRRLVSEVDRTARLRAYRLIRDRKLVKAIRRLAA